MKYLPDKNNRILVKAFTRTASLSLILSSALSAYYGVYLLDETDIIDRAYKVDHKSDTVSLEQGIDAYIVEKQGQLPTSLQNLESGTYDVCKQGIGECPEGSISLDVLVNEGYLQEIPSSYIAETDTLTGYKLTYNSDRYLISIQNEEVNLGILNQIQSTGSQVFNSAITINDNRYDSKDIVIEKNAVVKMSGKHKFASFTNLGKLEVILNKNSSQPDLEVIANEFLNEGEISADNIRITGGGNMKFTIINDFVNHGTLSSRNKLSKNPNSTGGNVIVVAKNIEISQQSISTASINGKHGSIAFVYQNYEGPELNNSKFFANVVRGLRIVE